MLWPLKFIFKLLRRLRLIAFSMLAGMVIAFYLQLREQQRSWGVVPADVQRSLAGDDLIADPDMTETRSLVVDAAPGAVWPWLVQMGHGRAGWYGYDRLDMKGSDTILPDFQELSVDDVMPTHDGGGFVVKVVDPARVLVLYLDDELVKSQMEAAVAEQGGGALGYIDQGSPGSSRVAGSMGGKTMPAFRATWTFILEPEANGRTRLVERFRVWTPESGLPQKLGLPMMGLGVFAMTRKHMLGVKERAEAASSNGAIGPAGVEPVEV